MPKYNAKISHSNWDLFLEKFEKFSKKAEKIGYDEPSYTVIEDSFVEDIQEDGALLDKKEVYRIITIQYERPVIHGWDVIGIRERIGDKVFVKGKDLKENEKLISFNKSNSINCEHCQTNRYRVKSYLLENEKTKTIVEVGSTCLSDFIGYDMGNVMFISDPIISEDCGCGGCGNDDFYFNLLDCLKFTSFYVNKFGYQKVSDEYYSTKDRIWDCHLKESLRSKDFVIPILTDKHTNEAKDCIAYFKNLNPEKHYHNSYMTNLIKISHEENFSHKLLGFAVSMIGIYSKITKSNNPDSKFVGAVGDRLRNIPVKCIFKNRWVNKYGYSGGGFTEFFKFQDKDGNIFIVYYTGSKEIPELNDEVILTGTIKDHNEFEGEKQTKLTRTIMNIKK